MMPSVRLASARASLALACLVLLFGSAWSTCPERIDPPSGYGGFGVAVALPGDLNADGWPDLAVGATALSPAPAPGAVLIYFGGSARDSIPDLGLFGTESGEQFGFAVVGPGDLNGDGAPDLVIGAPGRDAGGTDAGRVYVYFGGAGLDGTVDLVLDGTLPGERFGAAVAGGVDLNADGRVDLVVGAPSASVGGAGSGAAYVFYGAAPLDATVDLTIPGEFGEHLGTAVALGGDVNADGLPDLGLGAPDYISGGRVKLYWGGPTFDAVRDRLLASGGAGTGLGTAVSLGEINGDGTTDVLVGAPFANLGSGSAHVFNGGAAADGHPDLSIPGMVLGGNLGRFVAAGVDLTGDGQADFAIGAPSRDVRIFAGGPTVDGNAERTWLAQYGSDGFGYAGAIGGDFGAFGVNNLIVGAHLYGGNGRVYLEPGVCFTVTGPQSVTLVPGVPANLRYCVRSCDLLPRTFNYAYSSPQGFVTAGSGTVTIAARDSACFDLVASGDGSCATGGSIAFSAIAVECSAPPVTQQTVVTRQFPPPEISSCILGDTFVDPGDTLLFRLCFRNTALATRTFAYEISAPFATCGTVSATAAVPPGDSLCVEQRCPVPAQAPCGNKYTVLGKVWDTCPMGPVVQCSRTVTITATSSVQVLCPTSVIANPAATLVRTFQLSNNSTVPLTYEYVVADSRGWGPPVAGTTTQSPGGSALVDFSLTTPSVLCSTQVDSITISVHSTTCPARQYSCVSLVTVPAPTTTLACAQDTTVVGGAVERRFRWRNDNSYAQTYDYSLADARGWGAPMSGSTVVAANQWGSLALALNIPDPCTGTTDTLALVLRSAHCPSVDLGCDALVHVIGVSAQNLCEPEVVVIGGELHQQAMSWSNNTSAPLTYTYSATDLLGWGAPVSGTMTLGPSEIGTALFQFVTPSSACVPLPTDVVHLEVGTPQCPDFALACSTMVYGSPGGLPDRVIDGQVVDVALGSALAVGDVTGDGIADLGAGVMTGPGLVRVFFGGPFLDSSPERSYVGEASGDGFGAAIAAPGDLNGDGAPDFVIGAPGNDAGGPESGRVYVHYGGPSLDGVVDRFMTGGFGSQMGASLAGVGDVNADGRSDLLVGLPAANGAALYFGGGFTFDTTVDLFLVGPTPGEQFSERTGRCGDLNGDGHADLVVGAPSNDLGGTDAGRVYVYFGGPGVNSGVDLVLAGSGGRFGDAVAGADLDGDGRPDLVVGAPLDPPGGRVFLYRGGPALDDVADLTFAAAQPNDEFGTAVATGDVDGDGFADLLVGTASSVATEPGRLWLYLGGPELDAVCDGHLVWSPGAGFGAHPAAGLDVTGDGSPDVVVDAASATPRGRIFVYDGGVSPPTDVDPLPPVVDAAPVVTALGLPRDGGAAGTWVEYSLGDAAGRARLEIFDIAGRRVRHLVDGALPPGRYVAVWNRRDDRGAGVSRGVYLVRLSTTSFTASRKIVVLQP